ncbi:MAG: hypothetical protein H0U21_10495 [Acidimicrobiia bacterium]|nr:hypothetical protein [Acidimicrobiia bacterium]
MSRPRRLAAAGAVWLASFAALRLSFLAPERCPDAAPDDFVAAAVWAGEWMERNQGDDGRYVYEYDRRADRILPGYNIVRHAGVTMSLYQLARSGHMETLAPADHGLDEMLEHLVPAAGGVALVESGSTTARLGASALMAAALAQRRAATGDARYDVELRGLGLFMTSLITSQGQMLSEYDLDAGVPVAGRTSRYSTGEAAWAFAQLHNMFPGEGWDGATYDVLDYLATARDEVEDIAVPPWADQWAAYTLGEAAAWGLSEDHVAYARSLAARFGVLLRTESQKEGWPVPFVDHRARGAGLGVWAEGIGALGHAAAVDTRLADLRVPIHARLTCAAAILVERQYDAADAAGSRSPGLVDGAWFRDGVTRMDDQQHVLSGLLVAAGELGPVEP